MIRMRTVTRSLRLFGITTPKRASSINTSLLSRSIATALTQRLLPHHTLHPSPANLSVISSYSLITPSRRSFSTSGPTDNISNPELYTETAYKSVSTLPNYAQTYQTQYVEVPHLLKSMFDEGPDGMMQVILTKCEISPDVFNK